MKIKIIQTIAYCSLITVIFLSCSSSTTQSTAEINESDLTQDDLNKVVATKYYIKFRFLSNQILTFDAKDEVSESEATKANQYYLVSYNRLKKITQIEFFSNNRIEKRWKVDPSTGNLTRVDQFKDGVLLGYSLRFYDTQGQTNLLVRVENYNSKDALLSIESYLFAELEDKSYFSSDGKKTKTEIYSANQVDMIRYYDEKERVIKETGTYDNNRFPYSLEYFYNKEDNSLTRVEYSQKNRLRSKLHYDKKGLSIKEDRYDNFGQFTETVFFDSKGNPIEKKK